MKFRKPHLKLLGLALSCVALGVGISAIASAGAATSGTTRARSGQALRSFPGARGRGGRHALLRAVQGELVVATKSGFAQVSFERGTVQSVSGQQLTLQEGTRTKTYKTVTLTIPAAARVRINHKAGTLSQLTAGQRVLVFQGPKRTLVAAHDPRTP